MGLAQCSAGPSKLGGRGYNYSIYKSKTFYIYFKRSWIAIPLTRFLNHPAALQCSGFFRISLHFFNSILYMWSPLSSLDFCHSINIRTVNSWLSFSFGTFSSFLASPGRNQACSPC